MGAVPFYTKPVASATDFQPRTAPDQIYNQIIADLKDAASVLLPLYTGADLGRITKGAANAMLGRVYMQKGDYARAKTVLQSWEVVVSTSRIPGIKIFG